MRICQGKLSHLSLPLLQIKREVLEVGPGTVMGGFQLGRIIHSASLFSDLVHFPLFDAVSCFAHGDAQQAQSTWWWFWCWTWGGRLAGFVPRPSAQRTHQWGFSGTRRCLHHYLELFWEKNSSFWSLPCEREPAGIQSSSLRLGGGSALARRKPDGFFWPGTDRSGLPWCVTMGLLPVGAGAALADFSQA